MYRFLILVQGYWSSPKVGRSALTISAIFLGLTSLLGQDAPHKSVVLLGNTILSSVTHPWYRSYWAYLAFGLLVFAFLYLIHLWRDGKLKLQKKKEEEALQHQRAATEEQESLQAQYSILEDGLAEVKKQLRSKTIALVKKTKENDEKGRILQTLKEEVDEITKKNDSTKFQWREVSRILGAFQEAEDNNFSVLIEELHKDFLTSLNEQYPKLTTYDQRLCVYLKSGLTTREMAEMMNVLPSSVNVSRSRLRKKLSLAPKEDLYRFLKGIE
jgi:DNA-binding NarL/FixJ family response regulator